MASWEFLRQQWGWDGFFAEQFPPGREAVPGAKVLELLLVNRLIDPGSQFRLERQWFDHSARGELLGLDFAVAEERPARSLSGPAAATQAGVVSLPAAALGHSVWGAL